MRTNRIFALVAVLFTTMLAMAGEVYRDSHVRFTIIDGGTIRLEYAPDGKFVDNKSFLAVNRQYEDVKAVVKNTAKQVTIQTDKMKLVYTKSEGGFTAQNLKITSIKALNKQFVWTPGTQQKGNLKGTYRTLDGYDGEFFKYDHNKPMPIEDGILATDGWTLLDDSEGFLFDGSEDWDWVQERKSAKGAQDWYFMSYGHDYKAALKSYTRFAGNVPMPPRYAFGYWWSRYWSYSDQDFRNLVSWFQKSDIPLDVLVIDMDWHPISEAAGGGWTGWDWNENLFPDYKQFLSYLDEQGVNATMNLHPAEGVRPFEHKYQEFRQRIGMKDGETREWLGSDKQYVKALFDTYLHPYMDEGVDFWWLDWQQWLNDKKVEGLSNTWWCNYIWFTDMEHHGEKRPMLYHRWGGLGNHRYQVGFSGDSYITWQSLKFLPYFNHTASNVLYGYWSHDIGGHQSLRYGTPVPVELYTRSMQMGEYLPILRTHSTKDPALNKEPWAFDFATQERLKAVINGRYALVPYIYAAARQDYETGISLCRPMYYDYPESKEAYDSIYRNQFMFGDLMMIAPITDPVSKDDGYSRLNVWLPQGEWIEYETGTLLQGGKTVERVFTIDEYPVYIKSGSIIPYYGKLKNLSGTDQAVTVRVFPGADKGSFEMYEDKGNDRSYATNYATTTLSYTRNGAELDVTIAPRKGSYPDMPARRRFHLALPLSLAPQSVTLDGKAVNFTYDGFALETMVDLGEINCAAGAKIVVKFADTDYALTDGLKARLARIQTAVADYKQADAGMVYTDALGYLEATPLRMSYHPEKQRETLEQFNTYYTNLPMILLEQMGEGDNCTRFLKDLNEPYENVFGTLPASCFQTTDGRQGFDVKFYGNMRLQGEVIATAHWDELNLNTMEAPAPGVKKDGFSLVAESVFTPTQSGIIYLRAAGDDGYRVLVDGKEVINDWRDHTLTQKGTRMEVKAGQKYQVRVEFYDGANEAILRLSAHVTKK